VRIRRELDALAPRAQRLQENFVNARAGRAENIVKHVLESQAK
jgi:hypothetical protein